MIEELILVRHGETVHNAAGIAQGWNDSVLSERGERQVTRLAERLAPAGVEAIFSSPLSRALATAGIIAAATGLDVETVDELREMSYGSWEGRSFLDVRRDEAVAYHRWIEDVDAPCPGGESHSDVRRRLETGLARIGVPGNGSPGPSKVVVVTHGTAIRIAVTAILGFPLATCRQFAQDNAAMNVFLRRGDRFVLKRWNDTSHCGE